MTNKELDKWIAELDKSIESAYREVKKWPKWKQRLSRIESDYTTNLKQCHKKQYYEQY